MKGKVIFAIIKGVVTITSIGLGFAQKKIADKELREQIAAIVVEEVAKQASKTES